MAAHDAPDQDWRPRQSTATLHRRLSSLQKVSIDVGDPDKVVVRDAGSEVINNDGRESRLSGPGHSRTEQRTEQRLLADLDPFPKRGRVGEPLAGSLLTRFCVPGLLEAVFSWRKPMGDFQVVIPIHYRLLCL